MEVGQFVTFNGVIYVIKMVDRGFVFMASYEAITQERFAAECRPIVLEDEAHDDKQSVVYQDDE